jgi:hypothetical protein
MAQVWDYGRKSVVRLAPSCGQRLLARNGQQPSRNRKVPVEGRGLPPNGQKDFTQEVFRQGFQSKGVKSACGSKGEPHLFVPLPLSSLYATMTPQFLAAYIPRGGAGLHQRRREDPSTMDLIHDAEYGAPRLLVKPNEANWRAIFLGIPRRTFERH